MIRLPWPDPDPTSSDPISLTVPLMEFVVLLCAASKMDAEDDQPHFARLMQVSKYINLSIPALVITSDRLQLDPYVQTFSHVIRDYSDRVYVNGVLRRQALERVLSILIRTIVVLPEELQRETPVLAVEALHAAFDGTFLTDDSARDYALLADGMFSQLIKFSKHIADYIRTNDQFRGHSHGQPQSRAQCSKHRKTFIECEFMSLVTQQLCEWSYDIKAKPYAFPTRKAGCSIACVNAHLIRVYLMNLGDWTGIDPLAKSELYFKRARVHIEMVCPRSCSLLYGIPLFTHVKELDTSLHHELSRYDCLGRVQKMFPEWPVYTLLVCRHLAEIINDLRSSFRRDWFLLALSRRARDSEKMISGNPF